MNEPECEWIIQYTPPFPRSDLDRIQLILQKAAPFVPGVHLEDPYDVITYLQRQMLWREDYCLLVDRNVVTRWTAVVERRKATSGHRTAAAILAFAQASELAIEPNIAFYELSAHEDPAKVDREIATFYSAVDVPPPKWADIALGRMSQLVLDIPDGYVDRRSNLTKPPYAWRRNYLLALKIGELHLKGGRPEELMIRLLDWMYDDFLIGGPAVQLASYYFAPGAPRRRLLKQIESGDRERALDGIRNAAWDLTLVSEWLRSHIRRNPTNEHVKRIYILCTLDEAVRRMASGLISFGEHSESELEKLARVFGSVWGPKTAQRLARVLSNYQSAADNPQRQLHGDPGGELLDEMIARGERTIRSWKPRRGED